MKKVKIRNLRIKLLYVPAEQPYYISEEPITWRIWKKITNEELTEKWSQPVVDKTDDEWNQWLEKCRKLSHEPIVFATSNEIDTAIVHNIIEKPRIKAKKQRHWEKDTRSIQRHRKNTQKAQKWADLIGVQLKTTEDPTLQLYTKEEQYNQPRWLVIRTR